MQRYLEKVGIIDKDPKEQLKEWTKEFREGKRALERQLRGIEREELKFKQDIKMLAKKKEFEAIRPLATGLVRAGKAKSRIHEAIANMNSVIMCLRHQMAQLRMSGVIESSTEMMKSMNSLMNVPEFNKTMGSLAYEMEKAGLVEEIMDEAFDNEDLEDEIDEEVDKVIAELTVDIMNSVPNAPRNLQRKEIAKKGTTLFRESLEDRTLVGAD